MPIRESAIKELTQLLGRSEGLKIRHLAQAQEKLEFENRHELDELWKELTKSALTDLETRGKLSHDKILKSIRELLVTQSFDIMEQAIQSTNDYNHPIHLAKVPKSILPRNLSDLMKLWDKWRAGKLKTPRQDALAKKIKTAYVKKIEKVWKNYSENFRKGTDADKDFVIHKVEEAAQTTHARAKMIVETETTVFYNAVRRDIYDSSPDVTHYFFIAVRDFATTKWCTSYKKGGRDGLVYTKGSAILEKETPACHWNCRSELTPLTPLNPSHLKLIQDQSRRRENRSPAPLPPGWNRR